MKNGLFEENGSLVYYKDDAPYHAGLIQNNGGIYYIGKDGCAVKGQHTVHTSMTNGLLKRGVYQFGEDCKLIKIDEDKNGLFEENGELIYYKNGRPYHAGIVKEGKDIYYVGSGGRAIKGTHNVHHEMANDILKRGTYTFGEDYKLVPRSYIAPKKNKKHTKKKTSISKKKKIVLIAVAVAVLIALFDVGLVIKQQIDNRRESENKANHSQNDLQIRLPVFDKEVLLCTDAAKKAYDGEITVQQAIAAGNPYRPFVFKYQLIDQDGILQLSENADMINAQEYVLSCKEKSVSIDNLKTGTTYYYKVTVGKDTYPGSFHTAESTRFISLPGVYNTRDIGGYTTLDGKKVKQGMLIRGTEIDGLIEPTYFLEKDAIAAVQETFGFVCDLDLRESSIINANYQTRLGKDVQHKFYNSPMYGSIFSADYQPALKQIFTDLADPTNYPMYLHCTYGADRTGTICFLLEGILNLPEEMMQRDYQLTGYFLSSYTTISYINSIYGGVEGYAGDTIQERIVSYLTSPEVGVTMEEIESIRSIFLEQ